MLVSRGMDKGTDNHRTAQHAQVPNNLISVLPLDSEFSAQDFTRLSREAESAIRARGKRPLFCGGTGLYFSAYAFGLGESIGTDPNVRRQLEALPPEALLEELRAKDPLFFE